MFLLIVAYEVVLIIEFKHKAGSLTSLSFPSLLSDHQTSESDLVGLLWSHVVGEALGSLVGFTEGDLLGYNVVGEELGLFDGLRLDFNVDVGDWLGYNAVGEILGLVDGDLFGFNVGNLLGSKVVGNTLGLL